MKNINVTYTCSIEKLIYRLFIRQKINIYCFNIFSTRIEIRENKFIVNCIHI